MGALEGKVAIVAGGTSGIGARIAELFVEEGASTVIAGAFAKRARRWRTLGKSAAFVQTDVPRRTR